MLHCCSSFGCNTSLLLFMFMSIAVSPALGSMPHKFKPNGTYRGVWGGYTHPIFLLQGNTEHLFFYWREWRHSYRTGTVSRACLGNNLPVHCARSKVNRKGKETHEFLWYISEVDMSTTIAIMKMPLHKFWCQVTYPEMHCHIIKW